MIEEILPSIEDCHDCADFSLVPLIWARTRLGRGHRRRDPRAHRRGDPRLPLLDGRARQRRAVVFLREPRAALPHRRLSRRPPVPRRDLRPLRPPGRRAARGRRGARARLARPFRALGDGRVQLRALFPDRPQGPDRAGGARARRRHRRAGQGRHRAALRDRRALRASRHAHRRAGPLLRAHALRRALARALGHRPPALGQGLVRPPGARAAAARRLPARPRPRRAGGAAGDRRPPGRPAPGMALRAGRRTASPRSITTRAAHFAMGSAQHYRWNEWGYQETVLHLRLGERPEARSGSTIPARRSSSATAGPPTGAAAAPCRASTSTAAWPCSTSRPATSSPTSPTPGSRPPSSTRAASTAPSPSPAAAEGAVLLRGSAPFEAVAEGPSAGAELRQYGRKTRWIVRVCEAGSLADGEATLRGPRGAGSRRRHARRRTTPTTARCASAPTASPRRKAARSRPPSFTVRGEAVML